METNIIPLDTTPTAVTVFPDRARVTRRGRARLAMGPARLEIRNLPLNLLPESVRAAGQGTAAAKLLGVTTRLEHFTETPAAEALRLEQAILAAEDADAGLLSQIAILQQEQKHLDGLGAQSEMYARGLALRGQSLAAQWAVFDFIRDRSRALQAEVLACNQQRREKARELDRLRRELKAVQSARPRQRFVAVVEVEALAAGELELDVTYVATGASWQPLYDLRLLAGTLELNYLAQVTQNTGEDWLGVALALSTARPSVALAIPELAPWYIRPRPPVVAAPERAKRAMPMAAPQPAMMAAPATEAPGGGEALALRTMAADEAVVSESGAALTYALGGAVDVPGNGEPRKVNVATLRLRPDVSYVTAPVREVVCYRRAEVKNESTYSLLPGSAQVFEGETYLGATDLEFVAPNQTFALALGVDERLRVKREMTARDVDKASLLGDRRRVRFAFSIEVENLRDGPQEVWVRDQMPVARDEQIRVRLEAAEPKPTEHSELNQLEWKLTVDKGSTRTIRFEYTVEHPRPMDVLGLP